MYVGHFIMNPLSPPASHAIFDCLISRPDNFYDIELQSLRYKQTMLKDRPKRFLTHSCLK